MIEADQLSRRYGGFLAVNEVSFAIGHGEIVGLLGHNGAGKTTIMKMLTGYLEPSAGAVRIDGTTVEDHRQQVQRQIGYLPENLPLYPELTVVDYLTYAAGLRGVDAAVAVPRVIEATELGGKAFDAIATLSRGYKQRLGVAQAILHEPRFLILDEPTNGLDPGQTQHMRSLIKRLSAQATVILSTHIMQEVNAVCDRVLILRNGVLALDERLEALRDSNRLQVRSAIGAELGTLLESVPGVRRWQRLDQGGWEIETEGTADQVAGRVAVALVGAGMPIYELASAQRDLESVFREVNESEGELHAV
ncbi:MAG: ABC transporter ATP-binding protein [Pseudomonadales bacterium]